jgi:cell division protease FtsH
MFLGREIHRDEVRSDQVTQLIDAEIDKILNEAHDTARQILEDNRDKLELISQVLIKYETIDGEQVMKMLETGEVPEELKNGKTPEEKRAEEAAAAQDGAEQESPDEESLNAQKPVEIVPDTPVPEDPPAKE